MARSNYRRFRPFLERLETRELLAGNAIWPIEPVANDHQMLTGFGDGTPLAVRASMKASIF